MIVGTTELRGATRVGPFFGRIACRDHPLSVELRAPVNISLLSFSAQINRSPVNYFIFSRQTSMFAKVANRRNFFFLLSLAIQFIIAYYFVRENLS